MSSEEKQVDAQATTEVEAPKVESEQPKVDVAKPKKSTTKQSKKKATIVRKKNGGQASPVLAPKSVDKKPAVIKTTKNTMTTLSKSKPDHPKFAEMIGAALKALNERTGSSRQAIVKYICANYTVDPKVANTNVKLSLVKGEKNGVYERTSGTGASGSFKLVKKQAKEATLTKRQATVKKATTSSTSKPLIAKSKAVKKTEVKSKTKTATVAEEAKVAKKATATTTIAKKASTKKTTPVTIKKEAIKKKAPIKKAVASKKK